MINSNLLINNACKGYKPNGSNVYEQTNFSSSLYERSTFTKRLPQKSAKHKATTVKLNSQIGRIQAVKAHWKASNREKARRAALFVDFRHECIVLNADTAARKMFARGGY